MDLALAGANRRPRALIVDDDERVHGEIRRLLPGFEWDAAFRTADAGEKVRGARSAGRPYLIAFVASPDAAARIWGADPEVQVLLRDAGQTDPGESDRLVVVRAPFAPAEIRTLARALAAKGALERRVKRDRLDEDHRHTHKLEAMGRLAAGIAHEINSPMQFVTCSVDFIRQSMTALMPFLEEAGRHNPDLAYLAGEIPSALDDADTGLARMAKIVHSMKALSHPGQTVLTPVDVNRTLEAALTVCQSEIRHHADVMQDISPDLPSVLGNAADLGQTFLNLIINAADAIREAAAVTGRRGTLRVRTGVENGRVVVAVADDGGGIPEAIRDRIFEPFFTTKEVGRGTGQGLAIARSIVVERLGGELAFETQSGRGTTFFVRLPVERGEDATT